MSRLTVAVSVVAVLATGCGLGGEAVGDVPNDGASAGSATTATGDDWVGVVRRDAEALAGSALLARCAEIVEEPLDASLFEDSPVYVGNEQPVEAVVAWAQTQLGYADVRIDREHNGWIVVSFTQDVESRRADLAELFGDVGVVAVAATRTASELEATHDRVHGMLREAGVLELLGDFGSYVDGERGVVALEVGHLTAEVWATATEVLRDQPVCIDGADPASRPDDSPQAAEGDGWRLLTEQDGTGQPYRTGIATSQRQYVELWKTVGLTGERPAVDFEAEVVIWFGAVHGSSCDQLRLRGVVVDGDNVHADIHEVSGSMACTMDAIGHAFIVSVPRDRLPADGFTIQLDADGPPAGALEERTVVPVDLSSPGSEADPSDIGAGAPDPAGSHVRSGDIIEVGYPATFALYVHCGAPVLGELNDVLWVVRDPADLGGGIDPVPDAWRALEDGDQVIAVDVLITEGSPPVLTATANGVSVAYVPGRDPNGGCD